MIYGMELLQDIDCSPNDEAWTETDLIPSWCLIYVLTLSHLLGFPLRESLKKKGILGETKARASLDKREQNNSTHSTHDHDAK